MTSVVQPLTCQVFAVVVASLSAVTAVLFMIPFVLRFVATVAWSFVLFILWIAVFGVFARVGLRLSPSPFDSLRLPSSPFLSQLTHLQMYLHENPNRNADIVRLKRAVWVDLANAIGWLLAALSGLVYWCLHRERRSRFTGRAKV